MQKTAVDILVLGGGYSGLWGAANAADLAAELGTSLNITLVSINDYLVHRPRMYECNPDSFLVPIRPLTDPVDIEFVQGKALEVDACDQSVLVKTEDGTQVFEYRRLILATGSFLAQIPVPGVEEHSFNVDSYVGAKQLDQHFQALASQIDDIAAATFIVVGAGMTGIELATEMRTRLEQHLGRKRSELTRVILVEQASEIGPLLGEEPRPLIEEALKVAGVEPLLNTRIVELTDHSATFSNGETISTRTTIITVGMKASSLTEQIPGTRDKMGRLHVDNKLRVKGLSNIFATGDVAHAFADDGHVALMSCQNSRTMGKYAGRNAAADLITGAELTTYRQSDYTTCLDLGPFGAVYTEGFERKLKYYGPEAKKRKMMINRELIYPPAPLSREHILESMRIDHRGR